MPVSYKLYQNHLTNGDEKYVTRVEYLDTVYEEDVIDEMIFHSSSMTKADMLAVLENYHASIRRLMLKGYRVLTPIAQYGVSIKGNFVNQGDGFDTSRELRQAIMNQVPVEKEMAAAQQPILVQYQLVMPGQPVGQRRFERQTLQLLLLVKRQPPLDEQLQAALIFTRQVQANGLALAGLQNPVERRRQDIRQGPGFADQHGQVQKGGQFAGAVGHPLLQDIQKGGQLPVGFFQVRRALRHALFQLTLYDEQGGLYLTAFANLVLEVLVGLNQLGGPVGHQLFQTVAVLAQFRFHLFALGNILKSGNGVLQFLVRVKDRTRPHFQLGPLLRPADFHIIDSGRLAVQGLRHRHTLRRIRLLAAGYVRRQADNLLIQGWSRLIWHRGNICHI